MDRQGTSMLRIRRHRSGGFTLLELMVSIVILIVLSSLVIPAFARARSQSRKIQCTNNFKQIASALVMYQAFEGRAQNAFPERLTHLADPAHQYIQDDRVFVCPMDYTHALGNTLKPGNPSDTKSDWLERANYPADPRTQRNCSYLYEFSTRVCETYNKGADAWNYGPNTWASDFLVEWYDDTAYDPPLPTPYNDAVASSYGSGNTPSPSHMSLFGLVDASDPSGNTGIITWQEAKFWQWKNGDICGTGLAYPGDNGAFPVSWFNLYDSDGWQLDPADMIYFGYTDANAGTTYSSQQHGYSGSWLPIARCFWHQTPAFVDNENMEEVLNLAVDGNTFYSAPGWEQTAWNLGRDGDMPDAP
jgi:type II secretory pathway pseudopilin PulG